MLRISCHSFFAYSNRWQNDMLRVRTEVKWRFKEKVSGLGRVPQVMLTVKALLNSFA